MTLMDVRFYLGGPPGTDYGDYVQQVDIRQENLNGVGTWEIIADPAAGGAWPAVNTITAGRPGSRIHITIDDGGGVTTMMRGYVDDVLPYLDSEGVHTRLYRLVGRNRGIDLAQHYVSNQYTATRGDLLITNALGLIGAPYTPTEITLAAVGAVPGNTLNYEADRTYLADLCREVANLSTNGAGTNNYDFYVDNTVWPANANLNFFLHGNSPSGVTLTDFPAAANNILKIEPCGESVGAEVKNYVEAHAGSIEDHWTELNAADYVGLNCVPANDFALFLNGRAAIRATNNSGALNVVGMTLTPNAATYGYGAGMNLSEQCTGSFSHITNTIIVGAKSVRIRLTDNQGNAIEFIRSGLFGLTKCFNCTDQPTNQEWRHVTFPLGNESGIEPAPFAFTTKGHWFEQNPPFVGTFNWSNVVSITFINGFGVPLNPNEYFVVDGLILPNLEPVILRADAVSDTAYGTRMKDFYRPDIKVQYELNDYADMQLLRMKDPKQNIRVTAIGQTGTPFASQTIEVVAPDFGIGGVPGIGNTVTYRIVRLHHRVTKNSAESNVPGYTFTTEYDLVRHLYYGTAITQLIDHTTFIRTADPIQSLLRETRQLESYRRRSGNVRLLP